MTKDRTNNHRGSARANTVTILSNEYISKTKELLEEFGELPIISFASFWEIKYGECIDFVNLKYDGGLLGFLRENNQTFELTKDVEGFRKVSLTSRPPSWSPCDQAKENVDVRGISVTKQRSMKRVIYRLFSESNFLWADSPWKNILRKKDISISLSAYESALQNDPQTVTLWIQNVRAALRKYPLGVRIDEIYRLFQCGTKLLRAFGVSTSMVALVDELPEVFYRKRMDRPERDLVFDGSTHTIPDLTGRDDKLFEGGREPESIVAQAINCGLYQRTLILIRESGQAKGLKINVWMRSLRRNFYDKEDEAFERDINRINTLTFFLALARYDLIELGSPENIRNDIRAFFPRRFVDLIELKSKVCNLNQSDNNSEEPEDSNNAKLENLESRVLKHVQ